MLQGLQDKVLHRYRPDTGIVCRKTDGTLHRLQKELEMLDLLILDEWGYVLVDREGVRLLFRVIADSYE